MPLPLVDLLVSGGTAALSGGFAAAQGGLGSRAEARLAAALGPAFGGTPPPVRLTGTQPVLDSLAGEVAGIDVGPATLRRDGVVMRDLTLNARRLSFSLLDLVTGRPWQVRAQVVTAEGVLTWDSVGALVPGVEVSYRDRQARLHGELPGVGAVVDADLDVAASAGRLSVRLTDVVVEAAGPLSCAVAPAMELIVDPLRFPMIARAGVRPVCESAEIVPEGIRFRVRVDDLLLDPDVIGAARRPARRRVPSPVPRQRPTSN